jgi:NADH dehydrogenase [ubiquinone] 1 alpha subcomplex assembly factor 7
MPLVLPYPFDETSSATALSLPSSVHDNRDRAHARPSPSLSLVRGWEDESDNALRRRLLREGVIPPPIRPRMIGHPPEEIDAHEPDPSGVSNADPEDVLDMASMYDPSIHLPDKPDFNSVRNRARYEPGTPLTDEMIAYIGVRGPITVAEYMRRALRDGRHGYYTGKGSRSGRGAGGGGRGSRTTKTTSGTMGDMVDDAGENGVQMANDDYDDWDEDDVDDDGHASVLTDDASGAGHVGGEHVIGSGGDFITAPEVSQLFGESLLVWLMTQYRTLRSPSEIQVIEIGPGKGTLICDILRSAITTFPDFASALTSATANPGGGGGGEFLGRREKVAVGVHLVEVTNGMRARQKESLRNLAKEKTIVEKGYYFQFVDDPCNDVIGERIVQPSSDGSKSSSSDGDLKNGAICFSWHDSLSSVPTHDAITGKPIPTFIICQELVDALPIHSFQKVEGGLWRERLVDVAIRDDSEASEAADRVRSAVVRRYATADVGDVSVPLTASSVSLSPNAIPSPALPGETKTIPRLRFVLPPDTTPALRSLLRVNGRGSPLRDNPSANALDSLPAGSIIEACPEGLLLVQDIADRIERCCGGAALIVDYGGDGSSGGDTLRGFWKHSQVHPLSQPGEVDVTADVDFGALREAVNQRMSLEKSLEQRLRRDGKARRMKGKGDNSTNDDFIGRGSERSKTTNIQPEAFGPICQGKFLAQMGIVQRVEKKIEDPETTDEEAFEIYSAMERLVATEQMGERYKVMAIAPKKDGLFPPPGF